MNTIRHTFFLVSSVFLSGCCATRESPKNLTPEKESLPMIKVKNLSVTDTTLTLDYEIFNPFDGDIRVCHSIGVYANPERQHAVTRFEGESLRIKLRFDVDRGDMTVFPHPTPIAMYRRLGSGESYPGRIVQDLPIKDYSRELWEADQEHKEVLLQRIIFEIGYFGPELNKFFDAVSKEHKKEGIEPELAVDRPYFRLTSDPLITEEMQDGRTREVTYISEYWPGRRDEESTEVLITDVNIPCSVPIEGK